FLLVICVMALAVITFQQGMNASAKPVILLLDILAFILITYIDHIQTVVLAVLIALLVPNHIRNTTDVHIWSVFVFVTVQVFTVSCFIIADVYFIQIAPDKRVSILPVLVFL